MKKWLSRFFDYEIVGEYFDTNGDGHFYKKYTRRYRLKRRKKK